MPRFIEAPEERIKQIYGLMMDWQSSRLSVRQFCHIVGISVGAFYLWKNKFTPDHPMADEEWMKIGGVIEEQVSIKLKSIASIRSKWLDYCRELEIQEQSN